MSTYRPVGCSASPRLFFHLCLDNIWNSLKVCITAGLLHFKLCVISFFLITCWQHLSHLVFFRYSVLQKCSWKICGLYWHSGSTLFWPPHFCKSNHCVFHRKPCNICINLSVLLFIIYYYYFICTVLFYNALCHKVALQILKIKDIIPPPPQHKHTIESGKTL